MMDALTAIRRRHSVKRHSPEPLPEGALDEIIEAAYVAPSGGNRQPRKYVVVTGRDALDRLAQVHANCAWLKSAQAAVAIVADPVRGRYWLEDSCVAAQNMWIAATAIGVGVAWSANYQYGNPEETARREGLVRDILGIPAEWNVPIVLGIGMPAAPPVSPKRPPMDEIVYWGAFGQARTS